MKDKIKYFGLKTLIILMATAVYDTLKTINHGKS
jgi:hypothetical protein